MAAITTIEFTDNECKVISAERAKGRVSARVLFSFALPKNDDAAARVTQRAQLLREALKTHKLKAQRVNVIIPKNYVMSRLVTLPSTVDSELAGMARFEAERHIPFNAERHVVAYHVLSKQGVQGSQVLLAAVDQPIAQEFVEVCTKAGLGVDRLTVSSLSIFNAYAYASKAQTEGKVVGIVNIGGACTDIVIVSDGVFSFSRASSIGLGKLISDLEQSGEKSLQAQDLMSVDVLAPARGESGVTATLLAGDAGPAPFALDDNGSEFNPAEPAEVHHPVAEISEETMPEKGSPGYARWLLRFLVSNWLVQLLKEVKRTYEFARRELNCPVVSEFLICGEGSQIQNLAPYFQLNFGIYTSLFDPLKSFDLPATMVQEVQGKGAIYAAVAGDVAPMTPKSVEINLLPTAYIEKRESKRQQQSWMVSGILALTALILAYFFVSDVFRRQSSELEFYQQKNNEMKSQVADLKDQSTRFKIISSYVRDEHGALELLEKISNLKLIPDKVTLTRFEYKKDEVVKIGGNAKTFPDVNDFKARLMETGFFDSVTEEGASQWMSLVGRPDKVLQYSLIATFKKRDKKGTGKTAHSATASSKQEAADGTE